MMEIYNETVRDLLAAGGGSSASSSGNGGSNSSGSPGSPVHGAHGVLSSNLDVSGLPAGELPPHMDRWALTELLSCLQLVCWWNTCIGNGSKLLNVSSDGIKLLNQAMFSPPRGFLFKVVPGSLAADTVKDCHTVLTTVCVRICTAAAEHSALA
jgi:hypothetical protein